MTNFNIIKNFVFNLDDDEEIKSMQEEYELTEDDNSKLTKALAEKSLYFDEKGIVLSREEWREIYMDSAIMITSAAYDIATGKIKQRPKNFAAKYIDLAIEKLNINSKEVTEDSIIKVIK